MARTVLREFTGGVSNEIDPQNLRPDQGEEALDINLKGFALEPGEGKAPIEGGHYYYRGEWIKDSKAVSFEESGVGVIKTFNEKRPEFEEIIKDDVNISRSLGPPLPPSAVVTGIVASEGTRGERPAEGSHLLKLPETALGGVDSTQSLITYEADSTTIIDDIHYYNGQAYWLVKSGNDWKVVTRAKNNDGEFTSTDVESSAMTHNSKGSFFRKGYFVCWDDQYIDSVALSNTSMATIDSFNTIDPNDGGDAGSAFAANAGGTFNSGATSNAITGVHIDDNGLITFSQRITTANTVPSAYTHSDNERWIRMPSGDNGCYVVFFRDGVSHSYSEAGGTSNNSTDAAVEIFTDKNKDVFTGWKTKSGGFTYSEPGRAANNQTNRTYVAKVQKQLNDDYGSVDYGIKYFVAFAKNDTWVRVRYQDPVAKPPEIFVIKCTSSGSESRVDDISFSRTLTAYQSLKAKNVVKVQYAFNAVFHYDDVIDIFMTFNAISGKNKFHWRYEAPIGNNQNVTIINDWGGVQANTQCSSATRYNSSYIGGTYTENHWPREFFWTLGETQTGTAGSHKYGGQAGTWYKYIGGNRVTERLDWLVQDGASDGSYKNNIASPSVPGKMNRLCSHVRGSNSTTQQGAFSVSELWTKATFASADNSLAFAEATTKNFRVGDWIKIGQNGSNKSMHLNLRGTAKDSTSGRIKEQTFITAQITAIEEGVKLILSPPEIDSLGTGKYLDEDCYPLISGFIQYLDYKNLTIDKPNGDYPVCAVLNKDTKYAYGTGTRSADIDARELNENVLVGHGTGRYFNKTPFDYNKYGTYDLIEVRGAGGAEIPSHELVNYSHRISWSGADYRRVGNERIRIPHAIRAAGTTTAPKLYYTRGHDNRMLYAQNGKAADTSAKKVTLSPAGGYYVDSNYLTHFDDKGITIFSTDLSSKVFVKGNPRVSDGLGLTGNVTDAKHFVDSSNAVWVFVKIGDYWKIVKTSNNGPQSSLLSYDFKKAIGFDGTRIWGISSDSTDGWDIQYATPFFEDHIIGSWIFYANSYTTVTPTVSAWGQVVNFRIGKKEDNGTPRYLSIDWKMDSGEWFGTGNPTIGLNHEAQKMTSEETWKWYPIDIPSSLVTSSTATVIANIPGVTNTYDPLATIEVPFKSKIIRDVVFFKDAEPLPSSGDTGGEHKISFLNYSEAGQSFYVYSENAFSIVERVGFEKEKAYKLGQSTTGNNAFDASKVGISSFLIGAPNMFNAYGPNIDIYYRASFVNKWGHESAPSPLSSKGIIGLDTSDDCIQVNFSIPFFRLTDADIEKIRLYRYGGDSSEFLHLKDIEMPKLPVDSDGNKYFPTYTNLKSITSGFKRKSATSPYYLFKTYTDISELSGFINSNFMFTATPSTMDGSWRINQIKEGEDTSADQELSGIGVSLTGSNSTNHNWLNNSTRINHNGTHSGTNPAVGQVITHPHFPVGTKIASIDSDYFDTDTNSTSAGNCLDDGVIDRGRAYEMSSIAGQDVTKVIVDGVETTAYTVSGNIITFTSSPAVGTNNIDITTTYQAVLKGTFTQTQTDNLWVGSNTTNWPLFSGGANATGVVKLENEYIKFGTIENNYTGGSLDGTNLRQLTRGVYGSTPSRHDVLQTSGVNNVVKLVEFELEMEHRNQDTTTLTEAITSPLTGSANVLNVTDTSVFPSASASGSPGPKKLLIGSEVLTYTGKTDTTFTGVTGGTESTIASAHGLNALVRSYDEVYGTTTVTDATIEIEDFGYRDKARTPISSLHYMQEDNYPPVGLEYNEEKKQFFETESQDDYFRYIKAVGSMYFGSLDADLRFSKYGSPEYWPVDAVVTLDSEIRWIQEHAGEGIVFTTNSVYRVRGTDPRAMVAFRVPDAKGLPAGYEHTVSDINGGLMWMTASDGLVMYSAGKVVYVTRDKHDLGRLKNPYSCVVDGEYWIFQEPGSGVGYKLDLTTGDLRLSQTSIEAYYAYFAKALGIGVVVTADPIMSGTSSDTFTVEEIGGIKANNIEWRSKKIDAGEPAIPKALGSLAIVYESLNSTSGETVAGGIRGQALAAELLGLDPDDLDAGDISAGETETITDLYSIFTKYDEPNQTYIVDTDGINLTQRERRTIIMPKDFNTSSIKVGDRVWNPLLADNTVVESVGNLLWDDNIYTVTPSEEKGITSYSIQDDTGDGGTGGYHGNWSNNGVNGRADSIDISSFDSSGGLRVNLVDTNSFLSGSNPSGGLPENDKIIFWGDNLPSNLVAGTVYYVKQTSDATKINLRTASTSGGVATVDTIVHGGDHDVASSSVALSGGSGSGAVATVLVVGNAVTSVTITTAGNGYVVGDVLTIDNAIIGGSADATCRVATLGQATGNEIAFVDAGSGTNYCSTTFFEATGGSGSGFIATYGINSANGIIYSVNIVSTGVYTTLPTSITATCPGTTYHNTNYSGYPACTTANITFSLGSTDLIFTDTDHDLENGDEIRFTATGSLPNGITDDISYYVTHATSTTFKVAASIGAEGVEYTASSLAVSYGGTVGSGVSYGLATPSIVLDKEPLRTGGGRIYWGNLPLVEVYLNNDDDPVRSFTLPPGDTVETQSMDLYLKDLKRFRTISVVIKGDVRVQSLSVRHYPLQTYQSASLHHSADVFYKGEVDFRVMLDGNLVYRKELNNAGDDFKEERIYLPASSFGQRAHYMNESRAGMIESVNFNGVAAV